MVLLTLLTIKKNFFFFCSWKLKLWNYLADPKGPLMIPEPLFISTLLLSQGAEQEEVDISEELFSSASPPSVCCLGRLPWFVSLGGLCCQHWGHPLIPSKSHKRLCTAGESGLCQLLGGSVCHLHTSVSVPDGFCVHLHLRTCVRKQK